MNTQSDVTRRRTCATYAGDMHAVEVHMLEAFERQVAITKEVRDANLIVLSLVSTSKRHAQILNDLVSSLGDVEKIVTDKLKSAVAGIFGLAAGFVDTVRPLAASKALRDDYTAINHAIVGYVMLSTTASALHNEETRRIADEFLNDYINLSQQIMSVIPSLTLKDLQDDKIQILESNAAQSFRSDKQWHTLFSREALSSQATTHAAQTSHTSHAAQTSHTSHAAHTSHTAAVVRDVPLAPNTITIERATSSQPVTVGLVENSVVETIIKPVIVEETYRPEKIIEVQPIVHREIQANEIHHIERHIYEKVETTGPTIVTNKPIIQETIRPHVVEEVQEIVHRELPAPFVEKVEKHITEVEVMPTLHTKEVILEKEEVLKADLIVEEKPVLAIPVATAVPAIAGGEKKVTVEKTVTTETVTSSGVSAGGHGLADALKRQ